MRAYENHLVISSVACMNKYVPKWLHSISGTSHNFWGAEVRSRTTRCAAQVDISSHKNGRRVRGNSPALFFSENPHVGTGIGKCPVMAITSPYYLLGI